MTTTDIIEATLFSWGADEVVGRPLPDLVEVVLANPNWLVTYAETCLPEQADAAGHLAHCLSAGIEPETVDGRTWFLPHGQR